MKYKFIPHTADIKFQAFGGGFEKCFENAGYALKEVICKEKIKNKIKKEFSVEGEDFENLLYNFLEEFLFLFETENFIAGRIKIKNSEIKDKGKKLKLKVEVLGGDSEDYEIDNHVKAITYNDMFIKLDEKKHQYICQVVVDV